MTAQFLTTQTSGSVYLLLSINKKFRQTIIYTQCANIFLFFRVTDVLDIYLSDRSFRFYADNI